MPIDVISFGALNIDLIYEGVIKEEGEDVMPQYFLERLLRFLGQPVSKSGGGSASNTVYALSEMGFSTGLIGKVGIDGDFLISGIGNVDVQGVARGYGRSGHVVSMQHEDLRSMTIFPGENDTLDESEIDLGYASDTRFIHMTSFVGDKPFHAQIYVARNVQPGVRISLDPGMLYVKARGLDGLVPLLDSAYILFVNEEELWELSGKGVKEGCEYLLKRGHGTGPQIIACKLGKDGSFAMNKQGDYFEAKPALVPATGQRYPTGTGDAYNAGFLAGLLLGEKLDRCATYGNILGAKKLSVPREDFHPRLGDLKFQ